MTAILLGACGQQADLDDTPDASPGTDTAIEEETITDPLHGLPTGDDQWQILCDKGYGDIISQAFCQGPVPPVVTSLADLRVLLDLAVPGDPGGASPNVEFTLLAHSTAIGGRFTTELNPRAFLMTAPLADGGPNAQFQVLAFSRGEPFVELVANDRAAGNELRFYLIRFHPECESQGGCNNADLLTPTVESNWTDYTIYDDATIAGTTLDCLQCHQIDGPGTRKILRMQELAEPWSHWFYADDFNVNREHTQRFLTAHEGERYAGLGLETIAARLQFGPVSLQRLIVNNGFGEQPNAFDSRTIRNEVRATGSSAAWDELYDRTVAGEAIAVPYYGVPHTDSIKANEAAEAYRDVARGALSRELLPDIRDIVLDSAASALSYRPAPGLDGREIMVHMCRHCHNSKLDQTLGRAGFNVDLLDSLSRDDKDEAIRRLKMPDNDARKMPPPRFHTLSDGERNLVIGELSQ